MNLSNGERFFDLVRWFNEFSDQLYSLFTKISNVFLKKLNFKAVKRYAPASLLRPWISNICHMGFVINSDYSLNLMMVLEKSKLTHKAYKQIPSLIIAYIEDSKGFFHDSYWELFSEENETIEISDEIITGKIGKEGKEQEFKAFQLDLELFNAKKAEEVINKEIMPIVKKII